MLFMVIERFKDAEPKAIGERFKERGTMLPGGVVYHASWIDAASSRCFQIMEAIDRESLNPWIAQWTDLVDFEVIAIARSADYRTAREC